MCARCVRIKMSSQYRLQRISESSDVGHSDWPDTARAKSNTRNSGKKDEVGEQARGHGMLSYISTEMLSLNAEQRSLSYSPCSEDWTSRIISISIIIIIIA